MKNTVAAHRLGSLIDGIFAIVMTILVLDIKVPQDPAVFRTINLRQFIDGEFQDIIIYMIVFVLLGHVWVMHHNRYHHIRHTNVTHIWLNIFLLMFIGLLPFSAALVNKFPHSQEVAMFLAANMFMIGLFSEASWLYAIKKRRLIDDAMSEKDIILEKRRAFIVPIVSLLAIAIAFFWPVVSSYFLLTIPFVVFFIKRGSDLHFRS